MKEPDDDRIHDALRRAIPPLGDAELQRDLWPRMLRMLDERPDRASWLDWALAALATASCLLFPEVIPGLLYTL